MLYQYLPCSTGVCRVAAGVYQLWLPWSTVLVPGSTVFTVSTLCSDTVFYHVHAGVIAIFIPVDPVETKSTTDVYRALPGSTV